jgi:hypothetical protein
MEAFFFYLIKASVCLVLFYLLYKFLLSRETFFRFNRYVLLSGMAICVSLPLIHLQTEKETVLQKPFVEIENRIISERINEIPDVESTVLPARETVLEKESASIQMEKDEYFSLSTGTWMAILYAIGFGIHFIFLAISIVKMTLIIRKGKKIQQEKYRIILTQKKRCPFSFGKFIVLSENDYRQNPDEIIRHEEVHAQMRHSLDIIFIEFFILLFWFNPVIWLLKRELQDVHEYEADNGVIQSGIDATKYQLLLIKKAAGERSYAIANSFNHSKIKSRLTMMLKKKTTQRARLKTLFFIPLAAVGLHAFAHPEMIRVEESLTESEGTTIPQKTQQAAENYFAPEKNVAINVEDTVNTKESIPPKNKLEIGEKTKDGTVVKIDTIVSNNGKNINFLHTKTHILTESGDSIVFIQLLVDENGDYTKVTKSGNQKVNKLIGGRMETIKYAQIPPKIKKDTPPPPPKIDRDTKQKFLDKSRLRMEELIQRGSIVKRDTIVEKIRDKISVLYTQTFILSERGDTLEAVYPLVDENGEITQVTKSGNQKVKVIDSDIQLHYMEQIHVKGKKTKNYR